jgi:hypothetical protein
MKTQLIFSKLNDNSSYQITEKQLKAISSIPNSSNIKKFKKFKHFLEDNFYLLKNMYNLYINEIESNNNLIFETEIYIKSFEEFCNFVYDNSF